MYFSPFHPLRSIYSKPCDGRWAGISEAAPALFMRGACVAFRGALTGEFASSSEQIESELEIDEDVRSLRLLELFI